VNELELEDNLSVNIARRFCGVGADVGVGTVGAAPSSGGMRTGARGCRWAGVTTMTSPLSPFSRLRVVLGTRPHLRHFTVLALESSADDTCAAVVTSSGQILSNVVLKQNHVYVSLRFNPPNPHLILSIDMNPSAVFTLTGQCKPTNKIWCVPVHSAPLALFTKLLGQPIAVKKALKDACISAVDVDGVAFTRGPGPYFLSYWSAFINIYAVL